MPVRGINHVTLSVRDIDRALSFYVDVLGCRLRARWVRGAYLEAGNLWLCLELDVRARGGKSRNDDSHVALAVDAGEFEALAESVRGSGATIWKENRSEGASLYFEDPDGHRLELHLGDLQSRLQACRDQPYEGMEFF
jgi:catechol 2,3-dioxygenase-like lactoylglutathione lyase family enzyme